MKIHTSTAPLLEALETVSLALPARQSLPELTMVRVDCSANGLRLTCDCLDAAVSVLLPDIQAEACAFLVSPKLLKASLRSDEASLSYDGKKLTVESGGKSTMMTLDVQPFHKMREPITTKEVDAKALSFGLKSALACVNSGSDAFDGCVAWDSEIRMMIGADGKAFHAAPVDLHIGQSVLIPRFCASIMGDLFGWEDEIRVGFDKVLHITTGHVSAWLSMADLRMPRMSAFMGNGIPKLCSVSREALVKALENIGAFAEPEHQKVLVSAKGDSLKIVATHNGNETAEEIGGVALEFEDEFCTKLSAVTRSIRHWTADEITLHKGDRLLMKPNDESGCVGVACLFRMD